MQQACGHVAIFTVRSEVQRCWMEVDDDVGVVWDLLGPFSDPEVPYGAAQAVWGGQTPVALKDSEDQLRASSQNDGSKSKQCHAIVLI